MTKNIVIDSFLGIILVIINQYLLTSFLIPYSPSFIWLHEFGMSQLYGNRLSIKTIGIIAFCFAIILLVDFLIGLILSLTFISIRSNFFHLELMAILILPLLINLIINLTLFFISRSKLPVDTRIETLFPNELLYTILGYFGVFLENLVGYICAGLIVVSFIRIN
jgi:hypothetical protein